MEGSCKIFKQVTVTEVMARDLYYFDVWQHCAYLFYAILLMIGIAFVISVMHFLSSDQQSLLSILEPGFCISQVLYTENFGAEDYDNRMHSRPE